jgi:D-sedoheptulose 7-phosphate isomerase
MNHTKHKIFFNNYYKCLSECISNIDQDNLKEITSYINETVSLSGKLILVGNGGSAAIASHVAVDFTKAAKIRAINFNEADLITCYANDYGYDQWVSQALESYADHEDLIILISSSGRSPNILNGALKAKEMGLNIVTLSGFDAENSLKRLGNINLWVDSTEYNIIEMTHHVWLLSVVDYLIAERRK